MKRATTDGVGVDEHLERRALGAAVRQGVRRTDALVLLTVPLVLLAVFALPASTRQGLALAYDAPTVLSAYTSHFVHLSAGHLRVNLMGYLLVVPTAYVLSVAAGRRRQFFVVFTAFVVAFPLALSALNLVFARPRLGVGFSGILLAFVGYLPVAILGMAGQQLHAPVDRVRSQWLFFFGLALIALVSGPRLYGTAIAAAALLAGVLFLLPVVEDWGDAHHGRIRRAVGSAGTVELLLVGALVFVGYLFVAFPTEVSADGTVVNIYSHVLGYALGYVATYLAVLSGGLNVD
ncbi:hypothetical protein [Halorarius litoreus]|uniref:hypothetical protein n=1 Tax=Halorarius litoreus TaxID=2962676 RepID=UPI0020CC006C|nr:hypothetical protein [Halorarius litoreus]